MIIVGVDAHKRTHTCVAVDSRGQRLGEKTVPATSAGNASALKWALLKFGPELTWAIEDVRTVSGRLEHELMSSGQRVVRVPTKLMARTRASARARGKSDSIDATEIARAALREPDLPVAQHDRYRGTCDCSPSAETSSSISAPLPLTGCSGGYTSSTPSVRRTSGH